MTYQQKSHSNASSLVREPPDNQVRRVSTEELFSKARLTEDRAMAFLSKINKECLGCGSKNPCKNILFCAGLQRRGYSDRNTSCGQCLFDGHMARSGTEVLSSIWNQGSSNNEDITRAYERAFSKVEIKRCAYVVKGTTRYKRFHPCNKCLLSHLPGRGADNIRCNLNGNQHVVKLMLIIVWREKPIRDSFFCYISDSMPDQGEGKLVGLF